MRHTTGTNIVSGQVWNSLVRVALVSAILSLGLRQKWTFGLNPRQSYENRSARVVKTDRQTEGCGNDGWTVQRDVDRDFPGEQLCPAGS
jgi:hypothetical protein